MSPILILELASKMVNLLQTYTANQLTLITIYIIVLHTLSLVRIASRTANSYASVEFAQNMMTSTNIASSCVPISSDEITLVNY